MLNESQLQLFVNSNRPLLVNNVARITGLSRNTIRWNALKGYLRGRKDENRPKIWLFERADVYQFMERRGYVL